MYPPSQKHLLSNPDFSDIYLQILASLNWCFLIFQSHILASVTMVKFNFLHCSPSPPTVYQYFILALSLSLYYPCSFVMIISIFYLLYCGLVVLCV